MFETNSSRKNKITLSDYDYHRDIENRLLMAQLSTLDLEVLEEILFSSLHISVRKIAKNLDIEIEDIVPTLAKLSQTGLLTYDDDTVDVDKEMRKYYESQVVKFDDDFRPGMDFLQGLLRKVPIQVLPTWYAIPRTSNNIFDSLIEKYLITPQIFQRYLGELKNADPLLSKIIQDTYNAPDFKISSKEIIDKYDLSREQFEEHMLQLEFSLVCCLSYNRVGQQWKEVVTPFYEWREYLRFLRDTEPTPIALAAKIQKVGSSDFCFVEDLTAILKEAKKQPLGLNDKRLKGLVPENKLPYLIDKLRLLKLADEVDHRLCALEAASDWLEMTVEGKAMYIYRHPLNRLLSKHVAAYLCTEKNVREAEKSIIRILDKGWVYCDDFLKGVMVPLNEQSTIMLKKVGKGWKYALPVYTEEELQFIKAIVMEWLFEAGIVAIGEHDGRECLRTTALGKNLFGR